MARIRSVHPGLFTDEAFVALSMSARIFCIGLWTEADDHGVFEWKPLSLKMRLFPADNIEVVSLLDELVEADQVRNVEHEGKLYGLIRNFGKWQRPKKPTYKHPFLSEWRTYVASKDKGSPPVPHRSPTSGGKSAQRKEEGGKREEEGGRRGGGVAARARGALTAAEAALIAGPLYLKFSEHYAGPISRKTRQLFLDLLKAGEDADAIILSAKSANPRIPADRWLSERGWENPVTVTVETDDGPREQFVLPAVADHVAKSQPISLTAHNLAHELAEIAGQDLKFIEPGWCGAAYRCQRWLDQGYPRELIVGAIKSMVAAKRPEKIGNITYFEKGLARFVAQHTKPVPQVVQHKAETIHAQAVQFDSPHSGLAAARRLRQRVEQAAAEDDLAADRSAVVGLPKG